MKTPPTGKQTQHADDDLQAQAWQWLRLLKSGDAREIDAQRLQRWVARSAAHREALSSAKLQWEAMAPAARAALWANPGAVPARVHPLRRYSRRAFLGAGLSAAAVGGISVANSQLQFMPGIGEWGADERTVAGEMRSVPAGDGVDLTLNTRTSIRRQSGGVVELINGEAAVDLQQGRAFKVVAGAGVTRADAGRFEVRNLDGEVCVTCLSGIAQVEHSSGVRTLVARQQVRYGAESIGEVLRGVDIAAVSAWREGALVFNQARLVDVVAEINRYRSGRVVLSNDAARERRVSGRFQVRTLDLALLQLQESLGLSARSLPAGVLILS